MQKFHLFVKDFINSPKVKTFAWQTVNGILGLLIIQLASIDWYYAPMLVSVMNITTKFINTNYLTK